QALAKVCDEMHVICEGAWGPDGDQPGRAYLAVDISLTAGGVMSALEASGMPANITQIHPAPAGAAAVKKVGGKKPAAKKTAAMKGARKPAAKKPAAKKPAAKKPATKKPAAKKRAAKPKRRK